MRQCNDWLREYLLYTRNSESPDIFHFWTGVHTIAGVLQRKVWVDMGHFQWTPNFYIILVAPAGVVSKSTTLNIGKSLLSQISGVYFGPSSTTWQALIEALRDSQVSVPLNDLNNEPLEGKFIDMACITCNVGELGTFLNPQDGQLVDFLTDLWDGKNEVWKRRTVGAGETSIKNPWINLIAATTPSWLKANVPEEMIGGGFASRVVFVFADKKRHLVPYPSLVMPMLEHKRIEERLLHDLEIINEMRGEMTLHPDAIEWGVKWYEHHWNNRPIHMASDRFGGYIARKQTHVHKLAIVLSAAESSSMIISRSSLEKANRLVTALESDMISVFESIGVAPTTRLLTEIISFIRTYKASGQAVTQKMLWRHCMTIMSTQDFAEATAAGVKAGYVSVLQRGPEVFYDLITDPEPKKGDDDDDAN